jgi:hypothetical protein
VGECESPADPPRRLPVAAVQRARAQGQTAARARAQADYWLPFLPDAYFMVIYPNNVVRHVVVN